MEDDMEDGLRRRVYEIMEPGRPGDRVSTAFNIGLVALIVLNVGAMMAETSQSLATRWGKWFDYFEIFSVGVFSVEYLLRLWSSTSNPHFRHPLTGRLRFALKPMMIIDLLAIAP